MDDHARILQQGIEIAPLARHRHQALERVGGEDEEGEKAHAHRAQHAEHARAKKPP